MASATERDHGDADGGPSYPRRVISRPDDRCESLEREARIRAVFGLRGQAPLPPADRPSLLRYYQHLAARLTLPFEARHSPEVEGADREVTVVAALDPREWNRGRHAGLLCEVAVGAHRSIVPLVEVETRPENPNFQLLEDYWRWFWNWRNQSLDSWRAAR